MRFARPTRPASTDYVSSSVSPQTGPATGAPPPRCVAVSSRHAAGGDGGGGSAAVGGGGTNTTENGGYGVEPWSPPAPGEKSCAHSDPTAAALAAAGGCATTIRTDQVAPAATRPWTSGCRRRRRQAAVARIASAHAAAATAFLCAVYDFLFTIFSSATMRPPQPRVPSRAGVGRLREVHLVSTVSELRH
jgi:hypothetical protein